ncbi:protein TESPA1 isoform X2 [Dromaius novaehollandiae]|uniref:protein TESPA1 isoform X2 n=1 Tax=Dromaius novaehollandiae TaxID=8790 RepID=UPI00311F323E
MEGASVLSPSSWEKRRAWARQSRCWRTTVVEEEAAAAMQDVPELQPPHLDDVFLEEYLKASLEKFHFSEIAQVLRENPVRTPAAWFSMGTSSSKIETWLQDCGSSVEILPEEMGLPGPYGCGSDGTSFEDDLTLGAEALLLPRNDKAVGRALRDKRLNLGHSMASSVLSSITNKTSSSITEILEWWQADAEEILYNLGFVQSEPEAMARIPARFFSAPSQARGIDFQLFLKAQVRRMEMEDPCLMLASRFQQVQALAATADAFFCLYSYVSRTPVQRISPTRLVWACPDIPDIRISPAKPEALSPVDRLKKAVSKMCLYTSPRAEESPRGPGRGHTAQGSRPSSLGKVVQEVLERARGERFRFDPADIESLEGATTEMPMGTSQHRRGAEGPSSVSPSLQMAQGVPTCPQHGSEPAPPCCRGERASPPRLAPPGTPTGTKPEHLEWPCPHCQGSSDSPTATAPSWAQGAEDAPCPLGAGRFGADDNQTDPAPTQGNATLSPRPGCAAFHAGWMWATPEQPEGLGTEGDSGFGSGSWGTSPRTNAGSQQCPPRCPGKTPDLCGACSPWSDKPRPGGRRGQRSRRRSPMCNPRDTGWKEGDVSGLQASVLGGLSPLRPSWAETRSHETVDSFEMEEVLSASEDDGDAHEEAGCSLTPSMRIRRSFMLHASSCHSDSSGFMEELVPSQLPAAQLHGTSCPPLPRPAADPRGTDPTL